jgi:predicted ThiF/HesA family dinucleotide-utilizing enzyme
MIVVTAELHSARTGKVTLLGRARIANDRLRTIGTGGTFGDYNCHFTDKAGRPWKECRVEKFPRKRMHMWDLLYRALHTIVGERNEPQITRVK